VQLLVDVMTARVLDISGDIAAGRGGLEIAQRVRQLGFSYSRNWCGACNGR